MSPNEQDFNWVEARVDCSLHNEFSQLKKCVENNVKDRNRLLPPNNAVEFAFHNNSEQDFQVSRFPVAGLTGKTSEVVFLLRRDHILVRDNFAGQKYTLTLTLNDEGECRFIIDGKGEFRRWQVMKRALEPIFFLGPVA